MGFSANTYIVQFPDENCNSTLAVTRCEEDTGCLHPAVISLREKTKVRVSESIFVCVCGGGREEGLEEICITKHPQVYREISKIKIQAETIKEWVQDVRGGERKGGGGLEGFLKVSLVAHSESLT